MHRRDLSRILIASAAQSGLTPVAQTQSCSAPCFPQSESESAAKVVAVNTAFAPGNVLRYGADLSGARDSSGAFQKACDSGAGLVVVPAGSYKIAAPVSLDIARIGIRGEGATLLSELANGSLLRIYSTLGPEACCKNSVSGLTIIGKNVRGVYAVDIQAPSPAMACGFSFLSCAFSAFEKFVQFFTNAFCVNFIGCSFSQGGAAGGIHVPAGGTNYGERISFTGCSFFNNIICLKSDYPPTQFHLSNCSLDYSHQIVVMNRGIAQLNNCYIENKYDIAHWLVTGPVESTVMMTNCTIAQTGPKPRYEIGLSASAAGTLDFRDCVFYAADDVVKPLLVAGPGGAYGQGNRITGFKRNRHAWAAISAQSSECPELVPELSGWACDSIPAGRNPLAIRGVGPNGRNAIVLQVSADGDQQCAYFPVVCRAGENVGVAYQAATNDRAAPFRCVLTACGAGGSVLARVEPEHGFLPWESTAQQLTTSFETYHACFVGLPRGTATCRVEFITSGATKPRYRILVSDIVIGRY
jgi:hypothetical protein